jgi:hypothetical protein
VTWSDAVQVSQADSDRPADIPFIAELELDGAVPTVVEIDDACAIPVEEYVRGRVVAAEKLDRVWEGVGERPACSQGRDERKRAGGGEAPK